MVVIWKLTVPIATVFRAMLRRSSTRDCYASGAMHEIGRRVAYRIVGIVRRVAGPALKPLACIAVAGLGTGAERRTRRRQRPRSGTRDKAFDLARYHGVSSAQASAVLAGTLHASRRHTCRRSFVSAPSSSEPLWFLRQGRMSGGSVEPSESHVVAARDYWQIGHCHCVGFPKAKGRRCSRVLTRTTNSSLHAAPPFIRIRTLDRVLYT